MSKISRRDLLQYIGAGGVGAVGGVLYGESVQRNVELLIPQVVPPDDYSPGVASWYNTVCNQCSAGCGISVRIREGKAKKIEGNPVHPVSQGRTCARGQAGLNALYNPDRIRTPLQNAGQRGSGSFEEISWGDALATVGSRLGRLKIENNASRVRLLTGRVRGRLDELFAQFMGLLGSDHYQQYDFTYPSALMAANKTSYGTDVLPYYDIKNATFVLSFGADYLGTWISPVHHSLAYGHLRHGQEGRRGKTVQIEPRMSLTGASADEWIPARPGTEGLLALGIAHALVSDGRYQGSDRDEWSTALAAFSPARVSAETEVSDDKISQLAREFGASAASLAIAGGAAAAGTNAVASVVAVNALNHIAGNLGKPGGVIFNSEQAFSSAAASRPAGHQGVLDLTEAMEAGDVEVLLVHDANPVYALPENVRFQQALQNVPLIVALSSFPDETTEMADLILPTNTYLESWGDDVPDPGVGFPVASISQPVVAPLYDTLSAGDIVLSLARQIGGELPIRMRWGTMEEFIRDRWREEYNKRESAGEAQEFEAFWQASLEAGVWGQPGADSGGNSVPSTSSTIASIANPVSMFAGGESDYPLVLHPYLTATFLDGRGANLPWLQELPDPMTSVVYGSWAELNPATAAEMGIKDGDVLEISSPTGTVRVPALTFPAIRPDVVAMPIGQGHKGYGRYAGDRGANPIHVVANQIDTQSGELAWAATRVKIKRTGEKLQIIKTDGVTRTLGRQILAPKNDHG
ncbi:MAG: molybdopterin-dependent oxidoreductase [Gammaproteobacteria bacterium]|nr:molybdopterin-dependent oxidoreductase [Gammaproteobacteria bacterium]